MDSSLISYSYVIRRVLGILPLLFGISILTFLIFYLSPVNPVVAYLGLVTVQKMPPEDITKVEQQLGLDTLTGYGLSMVLGVILGLASATGEGSYLDRFLHRLNYILHSTPTFLVALLAMLVFSVWLGWLPSSRMVSVDEPITL